jgi:uncharacterized protein (DUF736 family)
METKANSGAMFINDRKEKESHPDFKGKVNVNGIEMEIAGWKRQSQNGKNYISLSFKEPYVSPENKEYKPPIQNKSSDPFDDIF